MKNKLLLIIPIILLLILLLILLINKEDNLPILNKNLNVEINSNTTLLSFVNKDNKVTILSKDKNIDTSILGEKELTIKYKDNNKEKEYKFKINIVDTQAPSIICNKELTTEVGKEIDLLKNVSVTDNSKEDIKVKVLGEYNFNKEGTYKLKYSAIDSSNNKSEEDFTLIVKEKKNTNNKTANNQIKYKEETLTNNSNYPTLEAYTIVPEKDIHEALQNPNNHIRTTKFYWYISKVELLNGEITNIIWSVSCDSVKTEGAKEKAKSYMPAPPSLEESINLYKENPNVKYGETILEVSY